LTADLRKLSVIDDNIERFQRHGHLSGARSLIMDFVKDLWGFLKVRKKFWLLPIILTLLFFGALMVFASGSAIAPFIYTIF
jgi:hypothetical protein